MKNESFKQKLHRWITPAVYLILRGYRSLLFGKTVIAITGSVGKTTAKELVHAVISTRYSGPKTYGSCNGISAVARTIFSIRPRDRFCVLEMGANRAGKIRLLASMAPPDIAVIIAVGLDHYTVHRSREGVAQEKGALVRALSTRGTAVLNADDPLVAAMAAQTPARVVRFGFSPKADLRASDASAVWPDRLSFTLHVNGERHRVRTRLLGTQSTASILAAIAVGREMSVPMTDILRAIESFEPVECRMSPVTHPDGVQFILDDLKAPHWTIENTLSYMRKARAKRRIMVFGTFSDAPGAKSRKVRAIACSALEFCDLVVFAGSCARFAVKSNDTQPPDRLKMFDTVREASDFLKEKLQADDLVLLKGSMKADHLMRIVLDRERPISCWRMDCNMMIRCTVCPRLYREVLAS